MKYAQFEDFHVPPNPLTKQREGIVCQSIGTDTDLNICLSLWLPLCQHNMVKCCIIFSFSLLLASLTQILMLHFVSAGFLSGVAKVITALLSPLFALVLNWDQCSHIQECYWIILKLHSNYLSAILLCGGIMKENNTREFPICALVNVKVILIGLAEILEFMMETFQLTVMEKSAYMHH